LNRSKDKGKGHSTQWSQLIRRTDGLLSVRSAKWQQALAQNKKRHKQSWRLADHNRFFSRLSGSSSRIRLRRLKRDGVTRAERNYARRSHP
jgi:hypothetical protein